MSSDITSIPGWQDMTGKQLKAFGDANPSTAAPINASSLQEWMRLNRLYKLDRYGVAQGAIPDLIDNVALPEVMRERIEGMLSQFREDSKSPVRTDDPEYAPLLAGLMQIVTVSPEALAEFYTLGGGRKYPLFATEAEAEAAQAAAIAAETLAGLRARIVNASALMGERIAVDSDPFELFAACWEDAI
jgi:hypothetical protein